MGGSGSTLVPGCSRASCPAVGSSVRCGDGVRDEDEACDDGNRVPGDGCSSDCRAQEVGFSCAVPGERCIPIARCGDGVVAATEQCDDGNVVSGDGCSARCVIELGKKCEGQPSACSDTACGDSIREGSEGCDDGNQQPFDGCSVRCTVEPACAGLTELSCASNCGDGFVAAGEACDDGNASDGDGCSAACTQEQSFSCVPAAGCEELAGQCVLRVPSVVRDFADTHPDFANNACNSRAPGAVAARLDANGRPSFDAAGAAQACLSTAANFYDWFTSNAQNTTFNSELVLFDNGAGGYVNRFGAQGEAFAFVAGGTERDAGVSLASCSGICVSEAREGLPPFAGPLRCEDACRPLSDQRDQLRTILQALQDQLTAAMNAATQDGAVIADLQAQVAARQAQLSGAEQQLTLCQTDCQAQLDARAAPCIASCKPCSSDAARFCIAGETQFFDGTPLFFPADAVSGTTAQFQTASIPVSYGPTSAVAESTLFPGAPGHNFYFSSELEVRFQYQAQTRATLTVGADDDVWVFLNGQLALDLGGVHEPETGSLSIDAAAGLVTAVLPEGGSQSTAVADWGLLPGNIYTLSLFHAERQAPVSSLLLALTGFEPQASRCSAICGDAALQLGEECDDGRNDGGYGECGVGCQLGAYCGDGIRQPEFGEDCDVGPGGDANCRGCRVLAR